MENNKISADFYFTEPVLTGIKLSDNCAGLFESHAMIDGIESHSIFADTKENLEFRINYFLGKGKKYFASR
jgi:hypothetical protein